MYLEYMYIQHVCCTMHMYMYMHVHESSSLAWMGYMCMCTCVYMCSAQGREIPLALEARWLSALGLLHTKIGQSLNFLEA